MHLSSFTGSSNKVLLASFRKNIIVCPTMWSHISYVTFGRCCVGYGVWFQYRAVATLYTETKFLLMMESLPFSGKAHNLVEHIMTQKVSCTRLQDYGIYYLNTYVTLIWSIYTTNYMVIKTILRLLAVFHFVIYVYLYVTFFCESYLNLIYIYIYII